MKQSKLYRIKGRVQGVGYRFFAEHAAQALGLAGYVRNLADGRVEVYATGEEAALEQLRQQLAKGPFAARVEGVEEQGVPFKKYKTFSIEG